MSFGQGVVVTPKVQPVGYELLSYFTYNSSLQVEKADWYRIICISACEDGESGEPGGKQYSTAGAGGKGGDSGAIAVSELFLEKGTYPITCNKVVSSFSTQLSCSGMTAGGGNKFNLNGNPGGEGGLAGIKGEEGSPISRGKAGGNNGGKGGSEGLNKGALSYDFQAGGGGGGGGRLPYHSILASYIKLNDMASGGAGGGTEYDPGFVTLTDGGDGESFESSAPYCLVGGGNGGGGGTVLRSEKKTNPGIGSKGSPGCVIIEKAIY